MGHVEAVCGHSHVEARPHGVPTTSRAVCGGDAGLGGQAGEQV